MPGTSVKKNPVVKFAKNPVTNQATQVALSFKSTNYRSQCNKLKTNFLYKIKKKIKHLEADLDSIYDKQSKRAHIRSTEKWVEKGNTFIIF